MTDEVNNPIQQPEPTPAPAAEIEAAAPEQTAPEQVAPEQVAPPAKPAAAPPEPTSERWALTDSDDSEDDDAAADEAAGQPVSSEPEPVDDAAGSYMAVRPSKAPTPAKSKTKTRRKAAEPELPAAPVERSTNMQWYILKVQSNREESIKDGLLRRVRIAGLDFFFGDIIIPIEMVTEVKGGKKRVMRRKLYPGYLVVQMEINEDSWFLVRETPGIGDFTGGAGHPTPMLAHEIDRILARQESKDVDKPALKISFRTGDRVKINEGTFENFEGEVDAIDQTNGRVTVMINIFGRSTPVELEYWQIEAI